MLADEKTMSQLIRMLLESFTKIVRELMNILGIIKYGDPFEVFVRSHSVETLEHLVTSDRETTLRKKLFGQQRGPD